MDADRIYRRKQFSSCDSCRKSRVACDAIRGQSIPGLGICTRCAKRNQRCTFEWMSRVTRSSNNLSTIRDDLLPSPPRAPNDVVIISAQESPGLGYFDQSPRSDEALSEDSSWHAASPPDTTSSSTISEDVSDWLQVMYGDGFEEVFGSWMGDYSCPFVFHGPLENSPSEQKPLALSMSISSLCRQFDRWMKELEGDQETVASDPDVVQAELEKEREIDHTLTQAIQTFSARWLPLTFQSPSDKMKQTPLIQSLWRDLRKSLLKSINRPCYRSVWSLYLFAMIPIPVGIMKREEESGIPAQLCVQSALQQVQHLRARQRSLEFNGSKVFPPRDREAMISSSDQIRSDFMKIESIIYWAAITFDTSCSLTFNTKSVLSSGLLGWELESSWRLVRSCTDIFHEQSEVWRAHTMTINDENANRIIAAAATWKLHVWKVAAVLKEALREGHEEEAVHRAYIGAVNAIEQFDATYRPLLTLCERRIQFLNQHTRLRWYQLMLHYHLCILIMIEAIEIARRTDLLEQMSTIKSEIEGNIINCLLLGLSSQFTIISRKGETQGIRVTVPLVAIDPYPHHVVAAVQLIWKGIQRDCESGNLDLSTVRDLQSILLQTLNLLPQSSESVRSAKEYAIRSAVQDRDSLSLKQGYLLQNETLYDDNGSS